MTEEENVNPEGVPASADTSESGPAPEAPAEGAGEAVPA